MEWVTVGFFTLVSLGLRLSIVAGAAFPINDGGLFYTFTSDLLGNGLRLPAFSSYNAAGIPLVYPPLAFYVTAVVHIASGISLLQLLQYVPAIVSAAAIPVFFALATELMESRRQAVLATFVFSMLPRTFDWLIMGGGITRSIGLLFSLLFLVQAVRLFKHRRRGAMVQAILTGALLIVSHPEAAVHTALTTALLLAWYVRDRAGLVRGMVVVLGIAAATAPWWLDVLMHHGLAPWLAGLRAAGQDSYNPMLGLVALLRFDFTDEPFLRLFGVLGLLGLLLQLARREYFLVAWIAVLHIVEPRGGALYVTIPSAMSAAWFLDTMLIARLQFESTQPGGIAAGRSPNGVNRLGDLRAPRAPMLTLVFLFLYGTVAAYYAGARLVQATSLASRDIVALEWISGHTSTDARFALVTDGEPLLDATSDWFPAITGRRSVASLFGTEWIPGLNFAEGLSRYRALQICLDEGSDCIKDWMRAGTEFVDYVYVRADPAKARTALQASLGQDYEFQLVYAEDGVELFEWLPQGAP
jgi:hypothetical protein